MTNSRKVKCKQFEFRQPKIRLSVSRQLNSTLPDFYQPFYQIKVRLPNSRSQHYNTGRYYSPCYHLDYQTFKNHSVDLQILDYETLYYQTLVNQTLVHQTFAHKIIDYSSFLAGLQNTRVQFIRLLIINLSAYNILTTTLDEHIFYFRFESTIHSILRYLSVTVLSIKPSIIILYAGRSQYIRSWTIRLVIDNLSNSKLYTTKLSKQTMN